MRGNKLSPLILVALLSGCASLPTGPSVMVLPSPGKTFQQFQSEDAVCRQWAALQIGQPPQQAANQNVATGAAAGTAIGAGLGAALGAASGDAGSGAAIGATSGLLVGTSTGAEYGREYGTSAQRRYDIAYMQCMYSYGNQIPVPGGMTRRVRAFPPPPPPNAAPPSANTAAPPPDAAVPPPNTPAPPAPAR